MHATPRGYPYPTGGDTPDMGYWNQQLAEAVDADLTDTWHSLTLTGDWVDQYSAVPQYTVRGGIVFLSAYLRPATEAALSALTTAGMTGANIITSLPPQVRPRLLDVPAVMPGFGTDRWTALARTTGELIAHRYGPGAPRMNHTLPLHLSWPI